MQGHQLTEEQKLKNTMLVLSELGKLVESNYMKKRPEPSEEPSDERAVPDNRTLQSELAELLNRYNLDLDYNIPDYILADYVLTELQNLNATYRRILRYKAND